MSDYIKRSDLAAIISDLLVSPWAARRMSNAALGIREALCLVQDIVNDEVQNDALKLPAADVVEVVRCKDCEWYREGNFLAPTKFCYRLKDRDGKNMAYNMSEMDYCSYGKRKEGEE